MPTRLLLLGVLVVAASAVAGEPPALIDVYASCDRAPRLDAAPVRPLTVSVTPHGGDLELVSVTLRAAGAVQKPAAVEASPASWRGEFDGKLCTGTPLKVEATVRSTRTKQTRKTARAVVVQQLD
jgi:hypothetical protein